MKTLTNYAGSSTVKVEPLPGSVEKSEFYRPGGAEMPRSLQIFRARNVLISPWRGTVLMNSFDGFRNTECFAPSRTNRHPL